MLADSIEYDIFGEGSHISTNQKRGNSAFSLQIGDPSPKIPYSITSDIDVLSTKRLVSSANKMNDAKTRQFDFIHFFVLPVH